MGNNNSGTGSQMNVAMQWSIGLAGIALLGLIMLILFGNLSGNVGFKDIGNAKSVTNETVVWLNQSGYPLDVSVSNSSNSGFVITNIVNATVTATGTSAVTIAAANFTLSTSGTLLNATLDTFPIVNVSYDYTYSVPSDGKRNTDEFIGNYTESVLNMSEQFPTVGTIIGIAILLFILIALLVFALRKMSGMGTASGTGGNFG
jgi:hypothetical protein